MHPGRVNEIYTNPEQLRNVCVGFDKQCLGQFQVPLDLGSGLVLDVGV